VRPLSCSDNAKKVWCKEVDHGFVMQSSPGRDYLHMVIFRGLTAILISLLLAACGGENNSSPAPQSDVTPSFQVSPQGRIAGQIDLPDLSLRSMNAATTRNMLFSRETTSAGAKQAGVWLIPSHVNLAASNSQRLTEQTEKGRNGEGDVWPPLINSIPVTLDEDGRFLIDVPADSGYSLIVIDPETGNAARIDDIDVEPGKESSERITSEDLLGTGSVEFSVVDSSSLQPMANVSIQLLELQMELATDAEGNLTITELPAGRYSLEITAEGFNQRHISFVVAAGEIRQLDEITLEAGPGDIVGQVVAPELSSPANIVVYLRDPRGGVHTTLTNEAGIYRIENLEAASDYSVIIAPADHETIKIDRINVESNLTASVDLVTLAVANRVGSIAGHARFKNFRSQNNHAGIIVSVEGTDKEAITARDGAFTLSGLAPGEYTVNLTDSNYLSETLPVTVIESVTAKLDEVALQALKGSLTGVVTAQGGSVISDANVSVVGTGLSALTDATGVFELGQVPVGTYTLKVAAAGHDSASRTITVQSDQLLDLSSQPIELLAYQLSGRVTLGSGMDHSGILVSISPSGLSAQTDVDGEFVVQGIGPGNYQLQLSRNGYRSQQVALTMPDNEPAYRIPYTIDLTRAYGVLKGQVTLPDRADHSGILVNLTGTVYTTTTDTSGYWSMTLPEGEYTQDLQYSRNGFSTATVPGPYQISATAESSLDPSELVRLVGSLTGALVDEDGTVLSGVTVQLTELGLTTTTDAQGLYTFTNVPTGDFTLALVAAGFQRQTQSVEVLQNETTDLSATPVTMVAYRLSGQVLLGSDVTDHSGATVTLTGNNQTMTSQSDATGEFSFQGVEPGNYQLQLSRNGYRSQQVALTMPDNEPAYRIPYTIDLTRAYGVLKGQVTLPDRADHSGILVNLTGTVYTTTTDTSGYWSMTLPEGEYTQDLQYSRNGFSTATVPGPYQISATAESSLDPSELVRLVGSLTGALVDEDGTVLSGVTVQLTELGLTTTTDAQGLYTFTNVPTGDFTLALVAAGFQRQTQSVEVLQNETTDLSATPVTMVAYRLSGQVLLGSDVTDHSGATVTLTGNNQTMTSQSDATGEFSFQGVEPGNYQLQINRSGYTGEEALITMPSDVASYQLPSVITLEAAKGALQGIARLDSQTDHSGIWVTLQGSGVSTVTDSTGRWSLLAPVGNYPDGVTYTKGYYSSVTQQSTVTLTEQGTYTSADALLVQQTAKLTGTIDVVGVTDLSLVSIQLTGISGLAEGVSNTIQPLEDGSFALDNLPLGQYSVVITYEGGLHETQTLTLDLTSGETQFVLEPIQLRQSYVKINNDADYTNLSTVTLAIGNTAADTMQLVIDGSAQPQETFATEKTVNLPGVDGAKTVTVLFWDADGAPLPEVADSINLDTTLTIQSFSATGAATAGDTLRLRLDIGEVGAEAIASLPGLFAGLALKDNGTLGDVAANDGVYERTFTIRSPVEISSRATAQVFDIAGNELTAQTAETVVLSTAPTIQSMRVSSDISQGTMTLSFSTTEPANTSLTYGSDLQNQPDTQTISSGLAASHTVTVSGLPANEITYFTITATDAAGNASDYLTEGKLAPPSPQGLQVAAGDAEVGIIWNVVKTDGMAGYNLYRSESGSSFVRVNGSELIKDRYYRDLNVANDTVYSYKLAAVDVDGNESIQSDVSAVTPLALLAGPTVVETGVVTDQQVWLMSRSPYQVVGNVRVREDATLLLLPGTSVDLQGNGRFMQVDGQLLGFGSINEPIDLSSSLYDLKANVYDEQLGAGSLIFPEQTGGYMEVDHGVIENVNIHRNISQAYQRKRSHAPVFLSNSTVFLDFHSDLRDFQIYRIESGHVEESGDWNSVPSSYYIRSSIKEAIDTQFNQPNIDNRLSSTYNYYSDGYYVAQVEYAQNSTFTGGRYGISEMVGSSVENASIQPIDYNPYDDIIIVKESVIKSSWVRAGYSQNLDDNSKLTMHFNSMSENVTLGARTLDINYNYWGNVDVYDIAERTQYSQKVGNHLYPIISGPELRIADFDQDGIPDYRDWDVDNDGYSDLQEDLLSDQLFNLVYDPLDATSYPSEASDADMDGIPDDVDADIDNDNLNNDQEAVQGTDPFMNDSDGDGVLDGLEVQRSYNPLDPDNYPYTGRVRDIVIDGSNVNLDGWVFLSQTAESNGSVTLDRATVMPGVKLLIDGDTRVYFDSSELVGSLNDPIIVRTTGVGNGGLTLGSGSIAQYINLKMATQFSVNNSAEVTNSDLSFDGGYLYGNIRNSYVSLQSSLNGNSHGNFSDSYITGQNGNINSLNVVNSYIDGLSAIRNSNINESIVTRSGGSLYLYDSRFENSLMNKVRSVGGNLSATTSDIRFNYYSGNKSMFIESSYIQSSSGTDSYVGLGQPEDTEGDGLIETEFSLDGQAYFVDGIKSPSATPRYGDWVDDPSVTQYFWNPEQVGLLWNPYSPMTFPEP